MEQKYQIGNEYGSIMWDIELLLKDIELFQKREFNVEKLYNSNPSRVDEEYAMTTDVTKPLVIAQLSDKIDKLIDGNHRLYKAHKTGMQTICCCYLSPKEHTKYICDYDAEVYRSVIDNWR